MKRLPIALVPQVKASTGIAGLDEMTAGGLPRGRTLGQRARGRHMNRPAEFSFRLYVAGATINSQRAIANLSALCLAHLPGRHRIEIVDVQENPERALADRVFLVPSLVILEPARVRTIIGTLSHVDSVLEILGLTPLPTSAAA